MYGFSHGYHGQQYYSWARTHEGDDNVDDDDDGGVAQHGGHTPNNTKVDKDKQPWFTVYFFDITQPCYD